MNDMALTPDRRESNLSRRSVDCERRPFAGTLQPNAALSLSIGAVHYLTGVSRTASACGIFSIRSVFQHPGGGF